MLCVVDAPSVDAVVTMNVVIGKDVLVVVVAAVDFRVGLVVVFVVVVDVVEDV